MRPIHPQAAQYASALGVEPAFCRFYTPHTLGRLRSLLCYYGNEGQWLGQELTPQERARIVRGQINAGETFHSIGAKTLAAFSGLEFAHANTHA